MSNSGQAGGYLADGRTPGSVLSGAVDFVNSPLGAMTARIKADGLAGSTTIILSAKHGQSPQDGASLRRVPDKPAAPSSRWRPPRSRRRS